MLCITQNRNKHHSGCDARLSRRRSYEWAIPRGIADQLNSKTILAPGAQAVEMVAKGEAEIGVGQTSEIVPVAGARELGPLPGEFASTTVFTGAIDASSKDPNAAKSLIQFLTGAMAKPVLTAKGFQRG